MRAPSAGTAIMTNRLAPLSDAELDELEAFLMSDDVPEDCMDIAMLDGFLTALIIGPNTLLPSQWLPYIWGGDENEPMAFASDAEAERVLNLIMRYYNDRVYDLREEAVEFEPLLYVRQDEAGEVPVLDEWCVGFITAIGMDAEGWRPLLESDAEQDAVLLAPMLLYGTDEGQAELRSNPELAGRQRDFADGLGMCVLGIRDYWLPGRKRAATVRRTSEKVGRNDPCPCGSGLKYKKCCGVADPLA